MLFEKKMYNIIFIVFIFICAGNAEKINETDGLINLLRRMKRKVTVEANFDKLIDENLPKIRGSIISSGMDPLELDDTTIPVIGLPGIFKGKISLTDGWLQQLSHIERIGNSHLTYSDKKLTIEMNLGWQNLSFDYRYLFEYLLYKRKGNIHGVVTKADIYFKIMVDFETTEVKLEKVKFKNSGKYDLQFEGHIIDPILNTVVKVVSNFSKDFITRKLQKIFYSIADLEIKEINKNLKAILEGYQNIYY
ncbi:uncharacterized protein LOC122508242 [Leptopilina heterotoma]|uniref:uncharacterized protein LOC122508242 n=1 Tax=Leptopilina heterotoma TaxID=63436 RepID=UPI001CA8C3D3|nr:uncharacterized protein LOC122508242 [Leptopilina heterotoma]